MKRFYLATVGVAFVAVLVATVGFAQPTKTHRSNTSAAATTLPTAPREHQVAQPLHHRREVRRAAVRLHRRPGQERRASTSRSDAGSPATRSAAPSRVTFVCAPTAAREPLLTTDRVDLVISTFTYTADRDTRIDFSQAYYKATGRLLVKNDGSIQKLSDIAGKKVATTSGSVYDRWMKNCFKNTEVVVNDTFTNAMLAFNQGRADAVMYDDAVLLPVAAADRTAKLTDDDFLEAPFGIGIKQGNTALKAWVDSRLELMKKKDQFLPILKANVAAAVPDLVLEEHPASDQHVHVRVGRRAPSVDTVCP